MKQPPNFGEIVEVVSTDVPELQVGDVGEVVGLSDSGEYVGLWIDRLRLVYSVPTKDIERPHVDG